MHCTRPFSCHNSQAGVCENPAHPAKPTVAAAFFLACGLRSCLGPGWQQQQGDLSFYTAGVKSLQEPLSFRSHSGLSAP